MIPAQLDTQVSVMSTFTRASEPDLQLQSANRVITKNLAGTLISFFIADLAKSTF